MKKSELILKLIEDKYETNSSLNLTVSMLRNQLESAQTENRNLLGRNRSVNTENAKLLERVDAKTEQLDLAYLIDEEMEGKVQEAQRQRKLQDAERSRRRIGLNI